MPTLSTPPARLPSRGPPPQPEQPPHSDRAAGYEVAALLTAPTSARIPGPPSVLIADDHRDAADSLAQLLRLCGFETRVAYSPGDALAEDPADVVILELRLPGIDGWELARRLRGRATARRPLLIAVTTCAREIDRRKSEEAGIDLHLVKPVDPAALLGVLGRFGQVLAPGRIG